jgi:hypothetical protein
MFTLKVRTDVSQVLAALTNLERGAPYAMATALTKTGQDIKRAETDAMASNFSSPTPYTMRALYLESAHRNRLQARVWLKDGNKPEHYLLPQIEGGNRPIKRFEQRLRMLGYMAADERAVPGTAVQLDAYGNMSRGQIVKILSQLRTAVVQGDFSNQSNSPRSRAKRAITAYFVSRGEGSQRAGRAGRRAANYGQHLPRGVWERRVHAWGTSVRPVLLFVKGTAYTKRFDFFGIAERVIASRFELHLVAAVKNTNERFALVGGSRS